MQIAGLQDTELPLQVDLTRRGIQQVRPAHDVGDALFGIVHDHRKLVGERAAGALHHKVADARLEALCEESAEAVGERHRSIAYAQAPRASSLAFTEAAPTGAWVARAVIGAGA